MTAQTIDIAVGTSDLARAMGWSAKTAYNRMAAIHREHPTVVRREGRMLVSTARELEPFIPGLRVVVPLERKVTVLTERVGDLESRLDANVRELQAFRRQAHEWFQKGRRA